MSRRTSLTTGGRTASLEVHTAETRHDGGARSLTFIVRDSAANGDADRQVELTPLDSDPSGATRYWARVDGRAIGVVYRVADRRGAFVHLGGAARYYERTDPHSGGRSGRTDTDLRAPMPGRVSRVLVTAGQILTPGEPLYGLEAMKMESLIRCPIHARVSAILVPAGQQVEAGTQVIELEPLPDHNSPATEPTR